MIKLSYPQPYFKVRGFSYLTGGQGEPKKQQQEESNGRLTNGSSNGLAKSNSYGGEGGGISRGGGSTGRLGDYIRFVELLSIHHHHHHDYIRRQQEVSTSKETSGNSLMSEFMNVRDTKFPSLSPAIKPR